MYDYSVEVAEPNGTLTTLDAVTVSVIEVLVQGPQGPGNLTTVPAGTSGWASMPDGTLWVEYTP